MYGTISMDLPMLDRYLSAVGNFLPPKNRADILAELRANLTAEFESAEEQCGAPLTEDQQADILRRHGHPFMVAGEYFPQQYLIGPAWIAGYFYTLKLAIGIAAAVLLIGSLLFMVFEHGSIAHLLHTWAKFPGIALDVFTVVTLLFATAEYCSKRFGWKEGIGASQWDPRKLPAIELHLDPPKGKHVWTQLTGAIFSLVLLMSWRYWGGLIQAAALRHSVVVAPVWGHVYELLLVTLAASLLAVFARMIWPHWKAFHPSVINLVTSLVQFEAANLLYQGQPWITLLRPTPHGLAELALLNHVIWWSVLAWILGLAIAMIVYLSQCLALFKKPTVPPMRVAAL
jgi:hypothetical protein